MTATLAPLVVRGREHPDPGYCRTYLGNGNYGSIHGDGSVIHTVYCHKDVRDTATSGSGCIRPDQDGAAIKAERDARAEARRFTPPEYRDALGKPARRAPGPTITAGSKVVEVVALRGRPRTADGTGEWSTWEEYTETDPNLDTSGIGYLVEWMHRVPKRLTKKEARAIVAEFSARVPHYEFQVVRAEVVLKETVLG